MLSVMAAVEAVRAKVAGVEPLVTRERARLAGTEFLYESTKIRNTLNFEFQPIDETLQWCCEYYMEKNPH